MVEVQNSFLESLPEEYRGESALANFDSVEKLAKGYIDTKRALSGKIDEFVNQSGYVQIPGEDADETEIKNFNQKLGVPENETGYESPELPEGFQRDETLDTSFKKMALAAGLSPKQFKKIYSGFIDFQKSGIATVQEQTKALYGNQFDSAIAQAQQGLLRLPEELQSQVKHFIGFDPVLTQVLFHVGGLFKEGTMPSGGTADIGNTFDSIQKEIDTIINSAEYKAGNRRLSEKVFELRRKLRKK